MDSHNSTLVTLCSAQTLRSYYFNSAAGKLDGRGPNSHTVERYFATCSYNKLRFAEANQMIVEETIPCTGARARWPIGWPPKMICHGISAPLLKTCTDAACGVLRACLPGHRHAPRLVLAIGARPGRANEVLRLHQLR